MASQQSSTPHSLQKAYPWIKSPLICSAPMRLIAGPKLAVEVSLAGGIGFLAAGLDVSVLPSQFQVASDLISASPLSNLHPPNDCLPIGVGFINWGTDLSGLKFSMAEIKKWKPAAVWFFAPRNMEDLVLWTEETRKASPETKVWVQVGTVQTTVDVAKACRPDVFVIQGSDAGGHGLAQSSSIITLLPECQDALEAAGFGNIPLIAAGGIMDGRSTTAAFALGADGVVMGTRFLACKEANISAGYQKALLAATDGGVQTVRTGVYDKLRGTTGWPEAYNARGVINKSYVDYKKGIAEEENQRLYEEAMKLGDEGWGVKGRITTYAGTGVGLVRDIKAAKDIVEDVRSRAKLVAEQTGLRF